MKNINPSALAPIITVLYLAIEYVTGHKFDKHTQDQTSVIVAAILTFGITVWGIFKNHVKEEPTVKKVAVETVETAKAAENVAETVVNETETQTLNNATAQTNIPNAGEGDGK